MSEENFGIPPISLPKLRTILKHLENVSGKDADVSFEFLIMSCFPTCYENIKDAMTKKYIEGYKAGKESNEANIS